MSESWFEVEATGIAVPTWGVTEARQAAENAARRFGTPPLIAAENGGRALADLLLRLGEEDASGMRVAVLVGAARSGTTAAVAARHLANRGARVTVLLEQKPRELPPLHQQLVAMLAVLGMEIQVAEEEDVDLYLPEGANYDRVIDGLGGHDAPPLGATGVRAALVEALARTHVPVVSIGAPTGLDLVTGAIGPRAVHAFATMAEGLPFAALAAAPDAVGQLFLADVSYSTELLSELGYPVATLFATGGLVPLVPLTPGLPDD